MDFKLKILLYNCKFKLLIHMKGCVNNLYMINGSLFIILGVICYLIVRGILIGTKIKHVIWWKEIVSFYSWFTFVWLLQ